MSVEKTNKTAWDYIEDDLYTSLAGIKQIDGYNFTVVDVVGWNFDVFPYTGNWPVVGVVIGSETRDDHATVSMRRCKRSFGIEMWVQAQQAVLGEPTHSRVYQQILADLEKALVYGTAHTRGGYAEWTELSTAEPQGDAGKSLIGCFVQGLIVYRHKVGDLYTRM